MTSGGSLQTYVSDGDRDMRTVDFDLRCALALNAKSTLHVRDFAIDCDGDIASGTGTVAIYGTFRPMRGKAPLEGEKAG